MYLSNSKNSIKCSDFAGDNTVGVHQPVLEVQRFSAECRKQFRDCCGFALLTLCDWAKSCAAFSTNQK